MEDNKIHFVLSRKAKKFLKLSDTDAPQLPRDVVDYSIFNVSYETTDDGNNFFFFRNAVDQMFMSYVVDGYAKKPTAEEFGKALTTEIARNVMQSGGQLIVAQHFKEIASDFAFYTDDREIFKEMASDFQELKKNFVK